MTHDLSVGTAGRWQVRVASDSVAEVQQADFPVPAVPEVWVVDVATSTLVLGSAQRHLLSALAESSANLEAQIDVVARHSGGGAVYLAPGEQVWIEVFVPAGDRLWDADVGRAFRWLGDVWADAVRSVAPNSNVAVHHGALVRSTWSDLVCFAGTGSGEVALEGRKVVGISQRRTRNGERFQCTALLRWRPEVYIEAFTALGETVGAVPTVAELASTAAAIPTSGAALTEAFLASVARY